ncbi:alpha/beta hydrolase [Streptomyces sp. A012304]|uniref:alpha/beta hydrolase n=1 Tax=Streptomyces sp. A012304 TaxID=375446 RepID=UPI002232B8B8|nr:alpha/beta hydrolase [Streptomyces sp. A012304]GKQ35146.1 peptidase [Streptomyces sp. A012304]
MQPLLKALTTVALAAGLLVGASPPGSAGDAPTRRTIDWKPCAQDASAECGTLRLPVDRSRPSGETFDLAVARLAAADPARRVGVLLVNPGGPGDSGVNFAIARARSQFSADILERFDIVGFDPRGVGASRPVTCSKELLAREPSPYPRDQAEFERLAAYNRELSEDCRRRTGPIFDHADTRNVVHDMDALRRALGEEKINYFGHSYGTLIGQQYAELYGDRIRAMALTANVDHSLGARQFLVSSAASAEDSFHQFVRWCDRTPSCALHGRDVTAVWDGVLAKADRGEIRDPEKPGRLLTAHDISLYAFKAFYGPDWDRVAKYVAGLDAQRAASGTPASSVLPSGVAAEETEVRPFHAVFCQDWNIRPKNYREYARLTAAELRAAPHMRGAPRVHLAVAGCVGRPDEVNNPQHRLRVTEAPTILMLHSRHDPANHFSWAARIHRQTRDTTVLLPYEGAGHRVYDRTDCTRDAVDTYLTELNTPRKGASCAAAEEP